MAVILTTRRRFLMGLTAAAAAPMLVRATSIMPVKVMPDGVALQSMTHPLMTDDEVYAWFQRQAGYIAKRRGVNLRARWGGNKTFYHADTVEPEELSSVSIETVEIDLDACRGTARKLFNS